MSEEARLDIEEVNGVWEITFNNPRRKNALTVGMRQLFADIVPRISGAPNATGIILRGAEGTFCSGVDLSEKNPDGTRPSFRPHPVEVLQLSPLPIIAAVEGYCLTGGLEVALASSFVIADETAQFADTHGKVNILPGWGLSSLLPDAIGFRRARQMMLTGEFIDAQRASHWGIVNEVVPHGQALTRAREICHAIKETGFSAKRETLRLLNENIDKRTHDEIKRESRLSAEWWRSSR